MTKLTFKAYRLRFTAPLHISNQRDDSSISLKTIQSDTLYAALMDCLAKYGKSLPEDGKFQFNISSLFPYYEADEPDAKPVFFLPMPLMSRLPELEDVSLAKKVKKVQWVDSTLYGDLLNGVRFFDGKNNKIDWISTSYFTNKQLHKDREGSYDFIKSEVTQRAAINDRTGQGDAMPYYVERIMFSGRSGLYFLATGETKQLDEALQLLSMEGLGTDRHVGFGYFNIEKDQLEIHVPDDANHAVSLSLLIPESSGQLKEMLASEDVAYDFTRRGGWITTERDSGLRKNVIYGFLPGSVFKKKITGIQVLGRVVDLKPEIGNHSVWRDGRAIMLPIKFKQ